MKSVRGSAASSPVEGGMTSRREKKWQRQEKREGDQREEHKRRH